METKEINFEEYIEKYLISNGGYAKGDEIGYNPDKGFIPKDLIEFVKVTQSKEWKRIEEQYGSTAEEYFINRVEKVISENGLLYTLRHSVDLIGQHIKLIYFKPETTLNSELEILYNANICKVVRQLHYSSYNNNSLDMVLFVNGFPLVTLELKNQYTGQTVKNAMYQYKSDRDPKEAIFDFNNRALVHFAVDLEEVYMTTKLSGKGTRFLPFNQGSNGSGNVGGKGNPNNPSSFMTSYLWERVLNKDAFLEILNKFIQLDYDKKKSFKSGKMIFPRYHQLDVVQKLIKDVKEKGTGNNYLIQHSAGSGKSNSISWLSYRLANLHNDKDEKIYDSVIVVTDRKVLDSQLQNNIYQFEHIEGTVEKIDRNKTSQDLLNAINDGKKIIITTLQKFPIIYKEINSANKRFAIIVDEAHSSQTGRDASKLKEGLGTTEEILEQFAIEEFNLEKTFVDDEDKMLSELAAHGKQSNLSFFAFTATPKDKTLQIFGTKQADGSYRPFHIYSMQQAIEEGFILDVLKNYMTYKTFYKIVKKSSEDPEIKASRGIKDLVRFETLHPHNISQKTAIIIEHFLNTTCKKINGRAKAMVVTASRLHAVKYVNEFKRYIKSNNLEDVKVLVAFSGEVFDPDTKETYTEPGLNIDAYGNKISESVLPEAFRNDFNVLIVAEKYQTGFDEPLLHTMFVDKPLSGVKAVQTLSRLNRVCEGKNDTFVLDFVNSVEDIQASFQPYYQATILSEGVDPNNVYDVYSRLNAYQVISKTDVDSFAGVYYGKEENMEKLNGFLYSAKEKYSILDKEDQLEFKSLLQSFLRAYTFIAQVARMMDTDMQANYIYCKYLATVLPKDYTKSTDISDKVDLEYYRLEKKYEGSIELSKEEGELNPPTGYVGKLIEEEDTPLSEIINKINEKYKTEFTNMDKVFEQLTSDFLDDEEMIKFAQNNDEKAFRKVYTKTFPDKAIKRYNQNTDLFEKMFTEDGVMEYVMNQLFSYVYDKLKNKKQ